MNVLERLRQKRENKNVTNSFWIYRKNRQGSFFRFLMPTGFACLLPCKKAHIGEEGHNVDDCRNDPKCVNCQGDHRAISNISKIAQYGNKRKTLWPKI